ncbi:MAG: hypothetical protein AB8G17_06370 [Gammaproteobacteria bacterium]
MNHYQTIALTFIAMAMPLASADQEMLQNDGFFSGAAATFQGGFISGEVAAVRFVPQIPCPCVVQDVTVLFGGTPGTEVMGVSVWEDAANADIPGNLLFTGDVTLQGSNVNLQVIDLTLTPIIVNGPFRVGLEFNHDGLPSVATDNDGTILADQNFILADLGGVSFWFRSATLGVSGDFIIRSTVDNLTAADTDGDGIADEADNCVDVANPAQLDTNNDGYGNQCDADLNDDCVVNAADLGLLRAGFFLTADDPGWNPDADLNGDLVINVVDLGGLRAAFFGAPGPSGTTDVCNVR